MMVSVESTTNSAVPVAAGNVWLLYVKVLRLWLRKGSK